MGGHDVSKRLTDARQAAGYAGLSLWQLEQQGLPTSVMIWNRCAGPGRGRLDPNYLLEAEYASSPWHRALHRWALSQAGPLLHVDLHGKFSEKPS